MNSLPSPDEARHQLLDLLEAFDQLELSHGRSGNLSLRVEDGMMITPSGCTPKQTTMSDLVFVTTEGHCPEGQRKPSSEWQMHLDIYNQRAEFNGIVHAHSRYATALACLREEIPAFHYMVAVAGGDSIRCAHYATFGTAALSAAVLEALSHRNACLLANHGQIACGVNGEAALELAENVEALALQYHAALQVGEPVLLDDNEMQTVLFAFEEYGRPDS